LKKSKIKSETQKTNLKNEMEMLEKLNHPGIMQIYELLHDDEYYYIVSELAVHGTLFDFLMEKTQTQHGAMFENDVRTIA